VLTSLLVRKKQEAQEIAKVLYAQGCYLCEIARHPAIQAVNNNTPVAKSSVHLWTRNVVISEAAEKIRKDKITAIIRENAVKGRAVTANKAKQRREQWQREGKALFYKDEKFRILCALYWGEGFKSRTCCGITNSDVDILCYLSTWLDSIQVEWSFMAHYYEENGFSEGEIKKYWKSIIPNLRDEKFRKFFKKTKKKNRPKATDSQKSITKHPYGLGRITAYSVYARQLVEGGIQELKRVLYDPSYWQKQ